MADGIQTNSEVTFGVETYGERVRSPVFLASGADALLTSAVTAAFLPSPTQPGSLSSSSVRPRLSFTTFRGRR